MKQLLLLLFISFPFPIMAQRTPTKDTTARMPSDTTLQKAPDAPPTKYKSTKDPTKSFGIVVDQDFFTPQNEDRNYTMGLSFNFTAPITDKWYFGLPWLRNQVDWLFGLREWHKYDGISVSGLQLFNGSFTPRNIESEVPVRDDRPYASITALSSSRLTYFGDNRDLTKQYAISSRLAIGILGTRISEVFQSWVHRQFFPKTRAEPVGWPTQISDGGEPTILYQIQFIKPIFNVRPYDSNLKAIEASWLLEANLGYYTNMATGISFRLGRFSIPYWRMNHSSMTVSNQAAKDPKTDRKFEFNFFTQFRGRAVLYNALLTGQFRKNEYELSREQVNRFIVEAEAGLLVGFQKFTLVFEPYILRTSEIALPLARNHSWGSAAITYSW
ncbi:lipid A-modifier LpxR family protein [Chitinophaga barathri]|uniref:DUF2219 family protein n=1 Tax=Chitinophaga barathri TaxID=1647451 RepID=A0A3N4MG31_9BACT|nr:lipid A-modifier LpxR family protein [Chitinophaga barathri]RPD42801.1 DUF2219 family protein [Chitinophaga barathri]